jgi:membrane protease YdiL (CAAX protease family)
MKLLISYLFLLLLLLTAALIGLEFALPIFGILYSYQLLIQCLIVAGFGGVFYLFRAIYYHKALKKDWEDRWKLWYYLRPVASIISGGIAFLFLKAGLLILEGYSSDSSSSYGFLAIAFIAGMNVNNFLNKIEELANSAWGIKSTDLSSLISNTNDEEQKKKTI